MRTRSASKIRKLRTRQWDGDLAGATLAGSATVIAKTTGLLIEVKRKALRARDKLQETVAVAIAKVTGH